MGAVPIGIVLPRRSEQVIRNIGISLVFMLLFALELPVTAGDKEKDEYTLKDAAVVLREMLSSRNLPPDTVAKAYCVMQLGGSSTDLVLLVMNEKGVNAVLNGKTKLGKDATATAGPVGTTAASISGSDILSYGNSNGLFAGVSLGGASFEPDDKANHRLYGKAITAKDIVRSVEVKPPSGSESLVSLLDADVAKRSN